MIAEEFLRDGIIISDEASDKVKFEDALVAINLARKEEQNKAIKAFLNSYSELPEGFNESILNRMFSKFKKSIRKSQEI
jgi:hypothetical protein